LHELGGVDFDDEGDAGCGVHAHGHAFGDDGAHAVRGMRSMISGSVTGCAAAV